METQSRIQAIQIARTITGAKLRWSGFEGGDHVVLTPTGAEIRVDLVTKKATWHVR